MKNFLIFIIINLFFSNLIFASESIYESQFVKVEINSEDISTAKIKEINKVKLFSLNKILKDILTKKDYQKHSKKFIKKDINYLIQNIIIDNEFISNERYSANIKINFDTIEIIKFLRNYQINYTDIESPKILIVYTEKSTLIEEGLSLNNSLYNSLKLNKYGLINLIYPELSPNDRFLAPYKNIINKDLNSFKKLALKYEVGSILIVDTIKIKNIYNILANIYNFDRNNLLEIGSLKNVKENYLNKELYILVNEWWKQKNMINNKEKNVNLCYIKNLNIYKLHDIKSKVNSISQVKSIQLKKINLGQNLYDINYYGDLYNLISKLSYLSINMYINSKQECIIEMKN